MATSSAMGMTTKLEMWIAKDVGVDLSITDLIGAVMRTMTASLPIWPATPT